MISGRVPVIRLLLAVLIVATMAMVLPSLAWAEPPGPPGLQHDVVVGYQFNAIIDGDNKEDGNRIVLRRADNLQQLPCDEQATGTTWQCGVDRELLPFNPRAESTFEVIAYQVNPAGEVSEGTTIPLRLMASALSIVTPPKLPSGDVIVLEGDREIGNFIRVEWTLTRGSIPVFDAPRECDGKDGSGSADESTYFACTYDSNEPDPRARAVGATASVEPAMFMHADATDTQPAGLVLPAVLPNGSYTATFNEYIGLTDLIDSISFSFTVGSNPPAPGGGAGAGGGKTGNDSVQASPLPLAPLLIEPTPEPGPNPEPTPTPTETPDDETTEALPRLPTPDDDVLRILILALIAFTVMAMSGARGMGLPRRLSESPVAAGPNPGLHRSALGDVQPEAAKTSSAGVSAMAALGGAGLDGTDDDAGRARPFGDAWGDRSVTWRFPGWRRLDALSFSAPVWLASRLPLVSRIGADGAYLRSALGVLWALLPVAGLVLGTVAATSGGAAPLPPALGLVAVLLVLAVLDSSAGIAAVTAFTLVTLARGGLTADGLRLGEGVRGLMGLAALWFVAPLVAGAARPLRRAAEPGHTYSWDRFGDTVIAALISGWAVQGIVGSLGDLTGRDLAITSHADGLAVLTIGAVVGRFLLEEAAAVLYPRRLQAVQETGELPEPSTLQQVRGLVFRAGLLAFFAGAFLGNCWQLWLGVAIFAIPQVMQLLGDRIPDVRPFTSAVPRGVVQTLVLVLVGTAIAYLVDSRGSDDELTAIRQGFVLLAVPGAALELLSVFGGESPKPTWTWPKQLSGAAVVAATAGLVLFLL